MTFEEREKMKIRETGYIDISDFEENAIPMRVGDSIFEEAVVKKHKVPPCAHLENIELLESKKAKRYIYRYGNCPRAGYVKLPPDSAILEGISNLKNIKSEK